LKEHLNKLLVVANDDDSESEEEHYRNRIPEEEVQLIEDFLDKFVFIADASSSKEQIDVNLALKALPNKVDEDNIYRIDLINFNVI
jgi:hypothetical protein